MQQALLQQFAAIESCLKDFVAFRNSGGSDDAQVTSSACMRLQRSSQLLQLLLLLDRVADGLAFVERWPTFKETAVYTGRLKQLSQWWGCTRHAANCALAIPLLNSSS